MADPQHDPYQLQKLLLDRRAFIGASAAGVGSLLLAACGGGGGGRAGNQAQILDTGTSTTPSAGSIHHAPYSLDVSSSLSEDHFLLSAAKIDPSKDTVVAYSRVDGLVEALLLQNGIISQVYRDPTVVGGWNIREIATGALDMVAGLNAGSSFREYQLHLFYRSTSGQMHHLLEAAPDANGVSSGNFNVEDSFDWGTGGKLGLSTNFNQELLAFCLAPSSAAGKKDATLHYYYVTTSYGLGVNDRTQGNVTGFEFDGAHAGLGGTALAAVAQKGIANVLIYVPSPGRPSVDIYTFGAGSTQGMNVNGNATPLASAPINRSKTNSVAVPNFPAGVTIQSIDYAYEPSFSEPPVAIVHTTDQQLSALSCNQTATAWVTQDLKAPAPPSGQTLSVQPSALAVPHQATSGLLANFFTVAAGKLSVLRQLEQDSQTDAESPVFNPAVPLQTGVQALSSQIRASTGDELIVVGDDGNLQMLAWTSDDGWTATEIHLPATEPIATDTYRVQLTLTDNWGLPVTGQTLSVTSSGPVFALVSGQSVSLSDTATSFTTDTQGQVTLPLLADGLSAPTLTVSGGGLQSSAQVSPNEPVNTYMQGKKPLNYMPTMDGSALQNATAPDGTYVFPAAHSDPSVASNAAGVLSNAATAGANPTDHSGQQQTIGSVPPGANATVEVQGIVLSFDKLAHDAAYAIKTGAAKVKQVAIQWDDTAERWVSQATADFDEWADQTLNTVINGLEDAAHVFHSVINHLGAEVIRALKWLELQVLELLADAVTLAGHYEDWLKSLTTTGTDLLGKAKKNANGWFAAQQAGIESDMKKVKDLLGSRSIGSLQQPPSSISSVTAASDDDASSQSSGADSHWLLQKVTLDNPPAPRRTERVGRPEDIAGGRQGPGGGCLGPLRAGRPRLSRHGWIAGVEPEGFRHRRHRQAAGRVHAVDRERDRSREPGR